MLPLNTNIPSLFTGNKFNNTLNQIDTVSKQLATGKRIVNAGDDPAGVGIVSSLRADIQSYGAVDRNIQSGLSLLDVASTSLDTQQSLLGQMKEIATSAASDMLSADQRTALQAQFSELQAQLDNSVNNASIFGQNLTGASGADVNVQVGVNAGDTFTLTASKSDAATLGVDAATIDVTDSTKASAAMTAIDTAINSVAVSQSTIGSQQTGLESISRQVENTSLNLEASVSRIEDADIPKLTAELAKLQTQAQIQVQMMSIANQLPQYILGLLR